MYIKHQLIAEIETTENLAVLAQLFEILQLIKQNTSKPNQYPILQLAGCLDDNEAQTMRQIITQEFSHTEDDW